MGSAVHKVVLMVLVHKAGLFEVGWTVLEVGLTVLEVGSIILKDDLTKFVIVIGVVVVNLPAEFTATTLMV